MTRIVGITAFFAATAFTAGRHLAGQVYAAEQFSKLRPTP